MTSDCIGLIYNDKVLDTFPSIESFRAFVNALTNAADTFLETEPHPDGVTVRMPTGTVTVQWGKA